MARALKVFNFFNQKHFFLWILSYAFGMIFSAEALGAEKSSLYNARGKRDPFMPLITQTSRQSPGLVGVESIEDVVIEGIVFDTKNGSMALVNGSVLRQGEEQGNVKVLEIRSDGVLFVINGVETFKSQYQSEQDKKG